jgi:hypothetical protein
MAALSPKAAFYAPSEPMLCFEESLCFSLLKMSDIFLRVTNMIQRLFDRLKSQPKAVIHDITAGSV